MLVKPNFSQQRKQKAYEREISQILYKIIKQENNLPSFSLSYCRLSTRGENLKIYLTFSHREENPKELLKIINQQYSSMVKKELAKRKKFSYLPTLIFLFDQESEEINILEEIIRQFNNLKHE